MKKIVMLFAFVLAVVFTADTAFAQKVEKPEKAKTEKTTFVKDEKRSTTDGSSCISASSKEVCGMSKSTKSGTAEKAACASGEAKAGCCKDKAAISNMKVVVNSTNSNTKTDVNN